MKDLVEFSNQLQSLIKENQALKDQLKNTEEWLKLAICVNGSLKFRTIERVDRETYQYFLDNTSISNSGNGSGGMKLVWNKQIPVTFEGRSILGLSFVKIEEINEVFSGIKIDKL